MVELGFFVGAFVLVGVGYVCGRRENQLETRGKAAVPSHIRDVWSLWDAHKAHEAAKEKVNHWKVPSRPPIDPRRGIGGSCLHNASSLIGATSPALPKFNLLDYWEHHLRAFDDAYTADGRPALEYECDGERGRKS